MKEELKGPKVEDVGVAVIKEMGEENTEVFNVYLINFKDESIEGVLVSSRGYGRNLETEEVVKTSQLRHFLDIVPAKSFKKIEPIMEDVFGMTNEYWLSFFHNNKMYDKKFIFLPESISQDNLSTIEVIEKEGVMIR